MPGIMPELEITLPPTTTNSRRASMTRKHFEAIAQAVSRVSGLNIREEVVNALIPVLREFNRAFDPQRFQVACNVPTNYGQRINIIGEEDRLNRAEIAAYRQQNPLPTEMEVIEEITEQPQEIRLRSSSWRVPTASQWGPAPGIVRDSSPQPLEYILTTDESSGVLRYENGAPVRLAEDEVRTRMLASGEVQYYTTHPASTPTPSRRHFAVDAGGRYLDFVGQAPNDGNRDRIRRFQYRYRGDGSGRDGIGEPELHFYTTTPPSGVSGWHD